MGKYKTDVCLMFFFFILYILIYFPMCVRHGVALEEAIFPNRHLNVMLCNGRWGVYLFRVLFDCGEFLPYGAGILAGLFMSGAIYLQTKIFGINKLFSQILYAVFYLGCTQWVYQLCYSNQSHVLALGFLCASAAVYFQVKPKGRICTLAGSAILLCCAISTYQTLILYYGVLMGAYLLLKCLKSSNGLCSVKDIMYAAGGGIVALGGYYAIEFLLIQWIKPSPHTMYHVKAYQATMRGDFRCVLDAPFLLQLRIMAHYFIKVPLCHILDAISNGYWVLVSIFIPALILGVRVIYMYKFKSLLCISFIAGIIIMPYVANAILLTSLPERAYVAEPLALASMWGVLIVTVHEKWLPIKILTVFGTVIFITAVCRVSTVARDEHWAWQRSKEEVLMMYIQAQQLANQEGLKDCPIYVLGKQPICTEPLFDIDKVGFCMNQAYPNIIKDKVWTDYYFYYLRLPRLKRGEESDVERHKAVYSTMPAWPADGSVRVSKNEIIIRIAP